MRFGKYLSLAVLLCVLVPATVFAKDKGNLSLSSTVMVGSTQLKPGDYKVEWNGTGSNVQVQIMKNGKIVATTTASLVTHDNKSPYDSVSVNSQAIEEIDFGNRKEALVLTPNQTAGGTR